MKSNMNVRHTGTKIQVMNVILHSNNNRLLRSLELYFGYHNRDISHSDNHHHHNDGQCQLENV